MKKEISEAKCFDYGARRIDWLIGEYSHFARSAVAGGYGGKHFSYAIVEVGVVEFVNAVVGEKVLEAVFYEPFIARIAEGAAHEHGSAVAYVGGDYVAG
jgi:hypothetical protein